MIGYVHQTRPRKGKKHSATCSAVPHRLRDHHICHGVRPLGCHVKNGSFSSSSINCMSMDSITEVFCHLNKMLIATKHIADNNFCISVRQHTGTSSMQHSPNLSTSLFLTYDPKSPDVIGEHH